MFKNYLYLFKHYFQVQREEDEISMMLGRRKSKLMHYNWNDAMFASFMMALMQNLEPR